mmetsp:Transcript_14661/g.41664  ORF Transcript_14661/g.41664 Transcript_14661/m.41664 type:complete len:97 (+) Transcript_14661:476-766(+)
MVSRGGREEGVEVVPVRNSLEFWKLRVLVPSGKSWEMSGWMTNLTSTVIANLGRWDLKSITCIHLCYNARSGLLFLKAAFLALIAVKYLIVTHLLA